MKNISAPETSVFRKKGFFIALYSCLGVVVILAVVVTLANRGDSVTPYDDEPALYVGAGQPDSYLAQTQEEVWFTPRQTPTPPTPPPQTSPMPAPPPPEMEAPAAPSAPPPAPVVETFEPFSEYDGMVWPVYGDVVMPFSLTHIWNPSLDGWRTNDNMQISAAEGEPVRVGADGRVIEIGRDFLRGNYVTIYHGDGWTSTLGQLMENILVSEGEIVRTGQVIGGVGQPSGAASLAGTHTHLHITRNETPVNPYELLHARVGD